MKGAVASVLGAGSWGTALACLLAGKGIATTLWARDESKARAMGSARENSTYLPGVRFPDCLTVTSSLPDAMRTQSLVLAVPARAQREIVRAAAAGPAQSYLCAAKGYEPSTRQRMSEVLREELGSSRGIAILAGPSHAEETARGIPTTVVVASHRDGVARAFQDLLMTPTFRVYTNDDVLGVETAASLKNVIAIAAGICDGLGFGDNTKGALLTRGLAEMARLGRALGANLETFYGLAGIGDLVTTCTSRFSRNRKVGELVARGYDVERAVRETGQACEGVETTRSALGIAQERGIELPITRQVSSVLFEGKDPRVGIEQLMTRDPKAESRV
jgi:glycerol-3-phosphate dehydrogenase (NAD(P)+)